MEILLTDNAAPRRQAMTQQLQQAGHQVIEASSAEQALHILQAHPIDLLLLDNQLSDLCVLELIRTVRQRFANWFPVILLGETDTQQQLAEGVNAGADDYLLRPVSDILLAARLQALSRIITMKQALDQANNKLKTLSTQDPLTGLLNRRGLDDLLSRAWKHHRRDCSELALMMVDIDQFKRYNDYYGHQQGDHCLRQVTRLLERSIAQPCGRLARYGGEEFMVVLPDTSMTEAQALAHRILQTVHRADIQHPTSAVANHVTLSIGISTTALHASNCNMLIEQADQALYFAKKCGRDQVVGYGEMTTLISNASSRPGLPG